ncbi:hypothetical protein TrVE_jg14477 [Triparma verrucosa]|uniref:Uncharacterized protein n=1 Tax=Triparma verrucosa TaxID=1606542 RepID=A0A9W6Z5P0_9STRA|nr:hypothetical protein TrVE_jg14477 [Triparma verrucosa]
MAHLGRRNSAFDRGNWVFVPHEADAWRAARVVKAEGEQTRLELDDGSSLQMTTAEAQKLDLCGVSMNLDMENLVDLDAFSEGSILHHVRKRYYQDKIYTYVGSILVAVNPFQRIDIYGSSVVKHYKNSVNSSEPPAPHVYALSADAYDHMVSGQGNQSVLISGESGAGKTETAKKVLNYLMEVAGSPGGGKKTIADQIMESNPVLESFGNAKTLRNDNSSRFGKWMEVNFNSRNKISGCRIVNYLLEKSRVTQQTPMERNYHVFYMLLAGADPALRSKLHLASPDEFAFLNKSGCTMVKSWDDEEEWAAMNEAFKTLQFSKEEVEDIYSILAAILHLGNIEFEAPDGNTDASKVSNDSAVKSLAKVSAILKVKAGDVEASMVQKLSQMKGRASVIAVKLTVAAAMSMRDALAKALYGRMFDWLVVRVNDTLNSASDNDSKHVGVLDIFGFEVFAHNSFEQLCINYANEKLQWHFNDFIFNEEMKMYKSEGVPCESMTFKDNQECLAMIEATGRNNGEGVGLLKLIDEQNNLGTSGTDAKFAAAANQNHGKDSKTPNAYFEKNKTNPAMFSVGHFAGPVEYDIAGFVEKNADSTSESLEGMARTSEIKLVQKLFERPPTEGPSATGPRGTPRGGDKGRKTANKAKTIGSQFQNQLTSLMTSLKSTMPHFIRCVKANHEKVPHKFDGKLCLDQLKYAGLFEAIRIRKAGYSYRIPHDGFARRFAITGNNQLLKLYIHKKMKPMDVCRRILENATEQGVIARKNWEVGKSRVFLKGASDKADMEEFRESKCHDMATKIASVLRMFMVRKKVFKEKFERKAREAKIRMENEKNGAAAIICQTAFRGHFIRKRSRDLKLIVQLKISMRSQDEERIKDAIGAFEGRRISSMAENVLYEAKKFLMEIKERQKILYDIKIALESEQLGDLQDLVERAEMLGMGNETAVVDAFLMVSRIQEKRNVHRKLLDFLEDDSQHSESIQELVDSARDLGIAERFLTKVEVAYKEVAPKLKVRQTLRSGVEEVNYTKIKEGLEEAEKMTKKMSEEYNQGLRSKAYKDFCIVEKAAARRVMKMLLLEADLTKRSTDDLMLDLKTDDDDEEEGIIISEEGSRLSHVKVQLCENIANAETPALKEDARTMLMEECGSRREFDETVRSYKWGKIFASWKYDSDNPAKQPDEDESFFGLHPADAYERSIVNQNVIIVQLGGGRTEEEKKQDDEREVDLRRGLKPTQKSSASLMQTPTKKRYYGAGDTLVVPTRKTEKQIRKEKLDMGMGGSRNVTGYEMKSSSRVGMSGDMKKMLKSRQRVMKKKMGLISTLQRLKADTNQKWK